MFERAHLQNTLGHNTLWDFRELLAQVMQNLNVNLVASLGHSYVARSGLLVLFSALRRQSVVAANRLHLEHLLQFKQRRNGKHQMRKLPPHDLYKNIKHRISDLSLVHTQKHQS